MPDPRLLTRLRRAVAIGLVAGVALLYLPLVGIVEAFKDRNMVTGVLTLGQVMLLVVPLIAGYRAAAIPRSESHLGVPPAATRLAAALVAGLVSGGMLGLLVLIARAVNLRVVLIRVSPALLDFLSFDQTSFVAFLLLAGLGAVLALVGGVLLLLPKRARNPITAGLIGILLMSMLEPEIRPRLGQLDYTAIATFIYRSGGLTVAAAIVTFIVTAAATIAWKPAGDKVRNRLAAVPTERRRELRTTSFVVLFILLLLIPQISGTFLSQVLVLVGLYLLLALGLNIVVGYAGLLDLGYVAFFAVGAYLTALLTSPHSALGLGLNFFVALPVVMLGAALTGLLIGTPVLRLRGDYLAIVTLGFGEIARILFMSDALAPWLGGVRGILGVESPFPSRVTLDIGNFQLAAVGPQVIYYPILFFCILAALFAYRLANSRIGRAWNAMREDEGVAEATGVSTVNYKLLAFALGATTGCLSGALFAVQLGSVFPGSFDILVSITVLAVIILGGMGSIPGVVVGALVLIGLPQLLREFAEYRLLVYGGVLVAMMLLRPEGLIPNRARQAELHEGLEEEDEEEGAERPMATQGGAA
jgi:branched-chain amino acid transport system permease protein